MSHFWSCFTSFQFNWLRSLWNFDHLVLLILSCKTCETLFFMKTKDGLSNSAVFLVISFKILKVFFEESCTCWHSLTKKSDLCKKPLFCYLCCQSWTSVWLLVNKMKLKFHILKFAAGADEKDFQLYLQKCWICCFTCRYARSNCKITYYGKTYRQLFTRPATTTEIFII